MSEKLDAAFGKEAADYVRQLQTEIERLRAVNVELQGIQAEKDDEIERLRAEREELLMALRGTLTCIDALAKTGPLHRGFTMWREAVATAIAKAEEK
jgi:FtsZ-binding cell division protein ZapB